MNQSRLGLQKVAECQVCEFVPSKSAARRCKKSFRSACQQDWFNK